MTSADDLISDFFKQSHAMFDWEEKKQDMANNVPAKDRLIRYTPETLSSLDPDNRFATEEVKSDVKAVEKSAFVKPKDDKLAWFKWLAWMDDLKKDLKDNVILPLKNKELFEKFKVWIPNWIMLYGPPGCGKTFIVNKLAEELGVPMLKHSMAEIWSSYQHETTVNIKKIFDEARKNAPCILFLDEIDSLTWKRDSQTSDAKSEELAQFLQEFNNIKDSDIIAVWATNRPDEIDSAIMRTWRFDRHVYVWPPDAKAREALFKLYTKWIWRPVWKIDYKKLASLTNDYTSSDIETICDNAARDLAWRSLWKKKISPLSTKDLTEVIKVTHSSLLNVDMSVFENFKNKWTA